MLLDIKQAYLTMYFMLDAYYWEKTKSDSLGGMLGDLSPYMAKGYISADPAAWEDWIDSVKKISNADLLTHDEVFQVIIVFLDFYMSEFGFDIGVILEDIKNMSIKSDTWLSFVNKSIEVSRLY
jgi:hypothetical protein